MTHGCARRMRSVGAGSRQSVAQAQLTIAQAQWSAMSAIDAALGALATHKSSNNNSPAANRCSAAPRTLSLRLPVDEVPQGQFSQIYGARL